MQVNYKRKISKLTLALFFFFSVLRQGSAFAQTGAMAGVVGPGGLPLEHPLIIMVDGQQLTAGIVRGEVQLLDAEGEFITSGRFVEGEAGIPVRIEGRLYVIVVPVEMHSAQVHRFTFEEAGVTIEELGEAMRPEGEVPTMEKVPTEAITEAIVEEAVVSPIEEVTEAIAEEAIEAEARMERILEQEAVWETFVSDLEAIMAIEPTAAPRVKVAGLPTTAAAAEMNERWRDVAGDSPTLITSTLGPGNFIPLTFNWFRDNRQNTISAVDLGAGQVTTGSGQIGRNILWIEVENPITEETGRTEYILHGGLILQTRTTYTGFGVTLETDLSTDLHETTKP